MISALLVFLALFVADARSEQECSFRSDSETGYKASWVYDAQNKRVQFSIEAKQRLADNSWTGIGFGKTMKNGDMIVIANSGGRLSASDRHGATTGTAYTEPVVDVQQDVQNFVGRIENGIVYATFSRLVNTNDRDDKPLEDPALNNCQFFMFPASGGSTTANGGDPSKVTLEQHFSTPTTKLICNISRCTGAAEGQQPTAPGVGPALSNNIQADELARDSVIANNRSQTPRPGQSPVAAGRTTQAVGGQEATTAAPAGGVQSGSGAAGEAPVPGARNGVPTAGANAPGAAGSEVAGPGRNSPPAAAGAAAGTAEAPGADNACEYVDGQYKAQWYYTEATKRLTFTLSAPLQQSRWTGIGFGQQMQNGDMIIIQDNNGVKASDRHGTGHVEPVVDAHQDIEAFKGTVTGGILQATFNRLLNTNDKDDLPIDDEAQNNCQYFIFPVAGGTADAQGRIQRHDATPKVKLICNAKACKKPADGAAPGGGANAAGTEEGAAPVTPSPSGAGQSASAGAAASAGPVGANVSGQTAGPGGVLTGAQPGAAGETPGAVGSQATAGTKPVGGQPAATQQPGAGQSAGQPGGAASGQPTGTQAGSTTGTQESQSSAGADGSGGPPASCPSRKDHHLCPGYVDDYLSVVYSRFPKTEVITRKACGLLATTQDYVVLRECCHYLSAQCGQHIAQNIRGLVNVSPGSDSSSSPAAGANAGPVPAAGAASTASPFGGSNGAAGIAGRGGPSAGSISTPAAEEDSSTTVSNPIPSQPSTQNPNPAVIGAGVAPVNPNPAIGQNPTAAGSQSPNPAGSQNPNPNPNQTASQNPGQNPNAAAASASNRNSAPNGADRTPEAQPGSPTRTRTAQNPASPSAAAAAPNPQDPKSGNGAPPPLNAARRPQPNDPSQPDAGSKPGQRAN